MTLLQLLLLFLLGILLLVELVIAVLVIYFALRGAPYTATDDKTLIDLLTVMQGQKKGKVVDLGSGDGKVVIALAKKGFEAHGYEFNPLLVYWSRFRINKAGLQKKAFIHIRDFWREDISGYDTVIIYGIPYMMGRLEKKLQSELQPGGKVISHHFTFPTWKPKKKKGSVTVYSV